MKRAFYRVRVAGNDISSSLAPVLTSLEIADHEGHNSDTARITIDDTAGTLKFPPTGETVDIDLGWDGEDANVVFAGVIDEVKSSGSRGGGRDLAISAKGMDAQGRAKEPQQRSFDGANLREVMERAGRSADVPEIRIAPELGAITRPWWGMNDESFLAFGERIAREVGGVFKIRNGQALLVPKTGGTVSGGTIPILRAAWGENLISWEMTPVIGRARHGRTRARWYDQSAARWREAEVEVTDRAAAPAPATATNRYPRADESDAQGTGQSDAREAERQSGAGTVTIDGTASAQPGGTLSLSGARPGIDGEYRIKAVEHSYSRQGWTTKLELQLPQGDAGTDNRQSRPARGGASPSRNAATLPLPPPAPPADTPPTP